MSQRHVGRVVPFLIAGSFLVLLTPSTTLAFDEPDALQVPLARKKLSDTDARRVEELKKTIDTLWRSGHFVEAMEPARKLVGICEIALGPNHWQTRDARRGI